MHWIIRLVHALHGDGMSNYVKRCTDIKYRKVRLQNDKTDYIYFILWLLLQEQNCRIQSIKYQKSSHEISCILSQGKTVQVQTVSNVEF